MQLTSNTVFLGVHLACWYHHFELTLESVLFNDAFRITATKWLSAVSGLCMLLMFFNPELSIKIKLLLLLAWNCLDGLSVSNSVPGF